jgi:clan AA aspartic protease
MGLTRVSVRVSDLAATGKPFEGEFLVDTGAMHCMAPADRLVEAGIQREAKRRYELASGDSVEYEYGFARVSFKGAETVTPVVFGPQGTEPILGVVALEGAGFTVDPVTETIKRLPAMPLK